MDKSLCPICLQPSVESTENSGSLTQWVSGCRCAQAYEKDVEKLAANLKLKRRMPAQIKLDVPERIKH